MSGYERDVFICRYFSCLSSLEPCYSTKQHMAKCRYRGQCVEVTDDTGVQRARNERLQTGDEDHDGKFSILGEEICREKRIDNEWREAPKRL